MALVQVLNVLLLIMRHVLSQSMKFRRGRPPPLSCAPGRQKCLKVGAIVFNESVCVFVSRTVLGRKIRNPPAGYPPEGGRISSGF